MQVQIVMATSGRVHVRGQWHHQDCTQQVQQCSADSEGMRCSFDAPEGLRDGSDSVTQDFLTNIYRMKQLGFNAVRLPYRQTDFQEPWAPRIIEHECQVAPAVSLS